VTIVSILKTKFDLLCCVVSQGSHLFCPTFFMNLWDWLGFTFSYVWLFSSENVFSFFGVRLFVGYFSWVIVSMFLFVLGG
jgi:hypothetical protein